MYNFRIFIISLLLLYFKEAVIPTASFLVVEQRVEQPENKIEIIRNFISEQSYDSAMELAINFVEENRLKENTENVLKGEFLIGEIFEKTGDYKKALEYFKRNYDLVINLADEKNDSKKNVFLSELLLKLGANFQRLSKIDSAEFYYKRLIEVNNQNIGKFPASIKAKAFNNLSNIYRKDSLYGKAKFYALKAVETYRDNNENILEALSLSALASIHFEEKDYKRAKEIYNRGIILIEKDTSRKAKKYKEDLYYNYAYALYMLKDYKAYEYQEMSYDIKDELIEKSYRRAVKEIEAKYNYDVIKQNEENKRLIAQRNTWVAASLAIVGLSVSLYLLALFRHTKRKNKLKISQKELEQQKQLEKINSENQAKIINATLDAKVNERKKISETLHDNVSTLLSSANLHLTASKSKFNGEVPESIIKTQQIIKEASAQIRDLSHTIISSILLKFGLEHAVKDSVDKYSNPLLKFQTKFKNIKRYEQNFEIKTYNIIQESINNIIKHSDAKNVLIDLKAEDNMLLLIIKDDGKGFDVSNLANRKGVGLNQIEARVTIMKGELTITSKENLGTKIRIKLPIKYRNQSKSV